MPCISMQPEASPLGKLSPGHGPPPRLASELCERVAAGSHPSPPSPVPGPGGGHSPGKPAPAGLL